jgi:hypothetical protein
MNKTLAAAPLYAAFFLAGCAGLDPSKLVPTAAATFQTAIGNATTMEAKLILAWQAENRALKYLTGGQYNCGDPNSPVYKHYVSLKDPGTLVTKEHVNKYWDASLKYVAAYLALLKSIANQTQSDQTTIKTIVSAGTSAAKTIPGIPSTAAPAITALGAVATDVAGLIGVRQVQQAAQAAEEPLKTATNYLKKYYPSFIAREQDAFNLWDECANEKLAFIRDQPLGKVRSYSQTYFVTANGFDLENAFLAYQTQRDSYLLQATAKTIDDTLDQIVKQNEVLANPGLTKDSLLSMAATLNTLYADLSSAASAVQNFGTPTKPVSNPAAPGTKSALHGTGMMVMAEADDGRI